ncbi:MAG TPA: BON domain-containing protein [Burkholderiaceae bacterium]|nr:BON domain-containing protein [Burkholderiaceae bacterium]
MRNEDQWRNRRRDEPDMDREFPRDRDYGAGSRYPRDEPFQFGDTDRGPRGGSYRESGRQYGGYDAPSFDRGDAAGQGYGRDPRYGERLQSVQGGNFGRGDPYADEGPFGSSRHEGYGLTGQRYGHEEAFSSPGGRSAQRYMPKGYKRSDARLQEDICERLSRSGLDVSEVSVSVSDGQVTLEGSVNERYMKHAIENYADDCMGVEGIDNRIRVERPGSRADTATRQMQEGAGEQASQTTRESAEKSERR